MRVYSPRLIEFLDGDLVARPTSQACSTRTWSFTSPHRLARWELGHLPRLTDLLSRDLVGRHALQTCSVGTWSFDIAGFAQRGPDRSRRLTDLLINFTRRGSSRSLRLVDLLGRGRLGRPASQALLYEDLVNRIRTVVTGLL